MREAAFVKQNLDKWERFEKILSNPDATNADHQANVFIELTDDLSYSRTKFPDSETTSYLNNLATKIHQSIYKNKKEKNTRFVNFWKQELPLIVEKNHKHILYSLIIFGVSSIIGALSAANDDSFVRLILGDNYVNMTLENIDKNDPMAVYKDMWQLDMFFAITFNNVRVSFFAFIFGMFIPSIGTGYILFKNGVMLGSFQYFFYQKGLLLTSALTIWIHGTLEISAIVIAGGAGMAVGNSILFPGSFSRLDSFKIGAKEGLKIVVGLIPIFIIAGFLESFVTRLTDVYWFIKALIIVLSAFFIIYYFLIYPLKVSRHARQNRI